jgi:hypothetical protein
MKDFTVIVSTLIYIVVGIICLIMAFKSIFSKEFLPFHEAAAGRTWDSIDKPVQNVIMTILRISGLGFLVVFLLMVVFPVVNFFEPNPIIKYSVPLISSIYCSGLFLFNFLLFKKTKAKTPWVGSLIALFMILISFAISLI